jgi:hypothetical protein
MTIHRHTCERKNKIETKNKIVLVSLSEGVMGGGRDKENVRE